MPEQRLRAQASEAYGDQARAAQEERWILQYLPLVRHVVSKFVGHLNDRADVEDLISAGTLGLVKAARGFDPNKTAEFKTYAYIRIRGAVIDELRGRTFLSTGARQQVRRVQQAWRRFQAERGRPPEDEELAAAAGVPVEQLYRTLEEARRQQFLSIHGLTEDAPALGDLLPDRRDDGPEQQAERHELLTRLAEAIRNLPQRDRILLLLYYERDLTMRETAEVLKVTESRVSQLHASALFRLAMKLKDAA